MNGITYEKKLQYAEAVICEKMPKVHAYIKYINPLSNNPSQDNYRFENSQKMKRLIHEVRTKIELTVTTQQNNLTVTERALTLLESLTTQQDQMSHKEQMALLRLIKSYLVENRKSLRRSDQIYFRLIEVIENTDNSQLDKSFAIV